MGKPYVFYVFTTYTYKRKNTGSQLFLINSYYRTVFEVLLKLVKKKGPSLLLPLALKHLVRYRNSLGRMVE